ncbi:hypothetical protein ACFPRL_20990 [Pseudoclavibacter helvolus]
MRKRSRSMPELAASASTSLYGQPSTNAEASSGRSSSMSIVADSSLTARWSRSRSGSGGAQADSDVAASTLRAAKLTTRRGCTSSSVRAGPPQSRHPKW